MSLTWDNVKQLKSIKLYAGDIYDKRQGWIGLSLTRNDAVHIRHDITQPIPLPNDSVAVFQAEDVFEHIAYEKLPAVVDEIYRILCPKGLFRLSVPDYRCDVLYSRSLKDTAGNILFDGGGGGNTKDPGHLWFPNLEKVQLLLSSFQFTEVRYLHYYRPNGSSVMLPIDYTKGHISRTPDFDSRVQNPVRPLSLIVDLIK
jgi:SAM-dependent methyltransferase